MNSKLIAAIVLPIFLTGCASIVGKSEHPLTLNSNPTGADFTITDERGLAMHHGTTPATISLRAGESYFHAKIFRVEYSKAGYAPQYADISAEISGWYFGNILFGGLIGALIVDPITGKMWKLQPSYTANLAEKADKVALNTAPVSDAAPVVEAQPEAQPVAESQQK